MALEGGNGLLSGYWIPKTSLGIPTSRCDTRAIRRETHALNMPGVAAQSDTLPLPIKIPELHGVIAARVRKPSIVRRNGGPLGHAPGKGPNRAGKIRKSCNALARLKIPQRDEGARFVPCHAEFPISR